jgi:hypothetical protein
MEGSSMFIGAFRHKDQPGSKARKVDNPRGAPAESF